MFVKKWNSIAEVHIPRLQTTTQRCRRNRACCLTPLLFWCVIGMQLVIPFQGSDGLFGSNVTSRSSWSGLRAWYLAVGSPILANGPLSRFFVYANNSASSVDRCPQIRLQIWRPSPTAASTFMLVWQQQLNISAQSAALYTVNVNGCLKHRDLP